MPPLMDHRSATPRGSSCRARRDFDDAAPVLTHHVVDEGTRQRHRRVGVDRDKELPLLWGDLPEFDRALPVIGPDRRLADAGIIDQDIDKPETVARLGNDPVDRLVACKIGLNRQQIGGLLPLLHNLRSARPCVVRSTAATLIALPSSPSTSSRPIPAAAPVTSATRCCSLIVPSYHCKAFITVCQRRPE